MKNSIIIMISIILLSGTIISCESSETKEIVSAQYTCPMHPEVVSDKPGTCPKCGMDLVKK